MAASSTRSVSRPSIKSLALFHYLLPSLITSLDCGFRYVFLLGYDEGDPFFDSPLVSDCRAVCIYNICVSVSAGTSE
jgi:hypothetical protein